MSYLNWGFSEKRRNALLLMNLSTRKFMKKTAKLTTILLCVVSLLLQQDTPRSHVSPKNLESFTSITTEETEIIYYFGSAPVIEEKTLLTKEFELTNRTTTAQEEQLQNHLKTYLQSFTQQVYSNINYYIKHQSLTANSYQLLQLNYATKTSFTNPTDFSSDSDIDLLIDLKTRLQTQKYKWHNENTGPNLDQKTQTYCYNSNDQASNDVNVPSNSLRKAIPTLNTKEYCPNGVMRKDSSS
jgi:hypothetical protein